MSYHGLYQLHWLNKRNFVAQCSNYLSLKITEHHSNTSTSRGIKDGRIKVTFVYQFRRRRPCHLNMPSSNLRWLMVCIEKFHYIVLSLKQVIKRPIRFLEQRSKTRIRFPHKLSLITQPKTMQQRLLMFLAKIIGFINGYVSSSQILFCRKRIFRHTPNEMFYLI